jgi:predicted cupin superfamily sugar epimerase
LAEREIEVDHTLPSDTGALVSCIVSPGFDLEGFELFPGAP